MQNKITTMKLINNTQPYRFKSLGIKCRRCGTRINKENLQSSLFPIGTIAELKLNEGDIFPPNVHDPDSFKKVYKIGNEFVNIKSAVDCTKYPPTKCEIGVIRAERQAGGKTKKRIGKNKKTKKRKTNRNKKPSRKRKTTRRNKKIRKRTRRKTQKKVRFRL